MKNRLAVTLMAASLLASGAAFAQSTTEQGAREGARTGGDVGGPIGAMVVGAAVGAGLEIPNAVITSVQGQRAPSCRLAGATMGSLAAAALRLSRPGG